MPRTLSLQKKLTLQFSIISFVGLSAFGGATYLLFSKLVQTLIRQEIHSRIVAAKTISELSYDENLERQRAIASRVYKKLADRIQFDTSRAATREIRDQVTLVSTTRDTAALLIDGRPALNHEAVDEISNDTQSKITIFQVIPDGLLRVSTSVTNKDGSRAVGSYIPNTSPVAQAVLAGKGYYGRAQVVGEWFITAYEPIQRQGKVVGAIFSGTPETSTARIKAFLKAEKLLDTGYFFVMDSKGVMVAHPTMEGQTVLEKTDLRGKPIFKDIVETKKGWIEYSWLNPESQKAQEKVALFEYIPQMDWIVSASFSKSELYAGINRVTLILVLVSVICIVVTALIVGFSAKKVSQMIESTTERLRSVSQRVLTKASEVEGASTQLSAASSQQASALQETAATTEEIDAIVKQNLDSTESSTDLASRTKTAADQGLNIVGRLNDAVATMNQCNQTTAREIEASYKQIEDITRVILQIEEKTKVIGDIVFQTKLLSFNASVEAARAGEHGKGFAVVAEEVANLAQKAGSSAVEIQKTLQEGMQKVTQIIASAKTRINQSTQLATQQTEECVKIAADCKGALQTIAGNIGQTHEALVRIATASREQSKAVEQVSQAIHQIDQATQNNSKLSTMSQNQSLELREESKRLNESVSELTVIVNG